MNVLGDLLARDRRSDASALLASATGHEYDYRRFCTTAWKVGNFLRHFGVRDGSTVALAEDPQPQPILVFLGTALLGGITQIDPPRKTDARVLITPAQAITETNADKCESERVSESEDEDEDENDDDDEYEYDLPMGGNGLSTVVRLTIRALSTSSRACGARIRRSHQVVLDQIRQCSDLLRAKGRTHTLRYSMLLGRSSAHGDSQRTTLSPSEHHSVSQRQSQLVSLHRYWLVEPSYFLTKKALVTTQSQTPHQSHE
ncbi:hypothetical protein ACFQL7_15755 [Halocatena marina]|uniref:AMP-dependent synthetase/ligase domain-containing protein n=1 Tax=Halocatena marina TaxID=2934937 RepID=A0ABD5YSK6_9EURY